MRYFVLRKVFFWVIVICMAFGLGYLWDMMVDNIAMGSRSRTILNISSLAFAAGALIPKKYTCDGEDISPPLILAGVPQEAQSLALIMDDPDAPMGTWAHWLVWNISPDTQTIAENSVPSGAVLGQNCFKKLQYGGPCPPFGTHRYFFHLFALDTKLSLPEGSQKKELQKAMQGHIIGEGVLMGIYRRERN